MACEECGDRIPPGAECEFCGHHLCETHQPPGRHDCPEVRPAATGGVDLSTLEAQMPSDGSSGQHAGRRARRDTFTPDASSPDVRPDGSLEYDSAPAQRGEQRREQHAGAPRGGVGWLKLRGLFANVVGLCGFVVMLYGIVNAFGKWLQYGGSLIVDQHLMVQIVALDVFIIFLGAGIVLFATR